MTFLSQKPFMKVKESTISDSENFLVLISEKMPRKGHTLDNPMAIFPYPLKTIKKIVQGDEGRLEIVKKVSDALNIPTFALVDDSFDSDILRSIPTISLDEFTKLTDLVTAEDSNNNVEHKEIEVTKAKGMEPKGGVNEGPSQSISKARRDYAQLISRRRTKVPIFEPPQQTDSEELYSEDL